MIKKLCIITDMSKKNFYNLNKKVFKNFYEELNYLIIIDVSKIQNKRAENIKKFNKKFIIYRPKNLEKLNEIFNKNNFLILYNLNFNLKYFKINFLLLRNKITKFYVSNLGYNPENFNYKKNNIFSKIKIFFNFRLNYYFVRILSIIGIWPKIDFYFEASSDIINSINNGLSNKIKRIGVDLSFFKKIIKINSKHHDENIVEKVNPKENKIVFIDGMLFDHKDVLLREGNKDKNDRKKYYHDLVFLLKHLSKLYKKEVVICLHPKNNVSEIKKDFKNLKCVKFKTEKMIRNAFIVLYHEGSSIIQAILLKKKIINLYGKYLGNYINERSKLYSYPLKIKRLNLENFEIKNKNNFLNDLKKSTNNFDKFINKNISFDKNLTSVQQIISFFKSNKIL